MKLILIDGYGKLISSSELVIKYKLMRDWGKRKMYDHQNLRLIEIGRSIRISIASEFNVQVSV